MKGLVRNDKDTAWDPATVIELCDEPRAYMIVTLNGGIKRRNRKFLKEITNKAARKLDFHVDSMNNQVKQKSLHRIHLLLRRSCRTRRQPERYGQS
jgi:hypothetical protein